MTHQKILILGLILGLLTLALSVRSGLEWPRWVIGISFVYFFSGYPLSLILLSNTKSVLERFVVSCGLSLFLTYPAGFLNVLREGQSSQVIFGYHLTGDIFFLLLIYIITYAFYKIKNK